MKKNILIPCLAVVVLFALCFTFYPKQTPENFIPVPEPEFDEEKPAFAQLPEKPFVLDNNIDAPAPILLESAHAPLNASFDIVRVEKDGQMLVAGKGVPYESFSLMDGETPIAKLNVDETGEWVFIPETPLPAGTHEIWIQDSSFNTREMSEIAVVQVPENKAQNDAFALLVSLDEDVSLLQTPVPEIKPDVDISLIHALEEDFTIQGSVSSNNPVNLYADNLFLGRAIPQNNHFKLNVKRKLKTNKTYLIRADKIDEKGKVLARVEVPFTTKKGLEEAKRKRIQVIKGDCLWNIARNVYGKGEAYTAIYQANKKIIKDPNLIYPNQVFVIPVK